MAAGTVAGVYAQALLELADERGKRTAVVTSCREIAELLSSALIASLDDPRLGKARAKEAVAKALAGQAEQEVLDLLLLLIDRNRLADAPAIIAEAVASAEVAVGLVRVRVTSAHPLTAAESGLIGERLKRALGPGVVIEAATDPALIAGIVLRFGDTQVDASVRRQLADMKQTILAAPVGIQLWDA